MIENIRRYLSFEVFLKKIALLPYKVYHIIIMLLILIGTICNYSSNHSLPMFWALVSGFVAIIYLDIYSIKQTYTFYNRMNDIMSGDTVLFLARKKLEKRLYSNKNWFVSLFLPIFIIPVVIYIIKYPLGLPIKIFAYTALYCILSLCFIGYTQYVSLIMMAFYCLRHVDEITKYDKNRPHKTDWIVALATLTNKQSNLFFFVGAGFIALLYLITFTEFYGVQLDANISRMIVTYLWGIVAIAIVIMFPIFSACSYFVIKNLITQLVENAIKECKILQNMTEHKKKKKKHLELLQAFNQLKILMLEKTPVYPEKPLASYAFSYIIAIINFAATVDAALSLVKYIS